MLEIRIIASQQVAMAGLIAMEDCVLKCRSELARMPCQAMMGGCVLLYRATAQGRYGSLVVLPKKRLPRMPANVRGRGPAGARSLCVSVTIQFLQR